jgi:hypothetical protein
MGNCQNKFSLAATFLEPFPWKSILIFVYTGCSRDLNNMSNQVVHRRKRSLSAHQKQMRFFTALAIVGCGLLAGGLFWLLNQIGMGAR